MQVRRDEVWLSHGHFPVAVGVTDEEGGCYVALCQMASISNIPKNTLEARLKAQEHLGPLMKVMVTQKGTLDDLKSCGAFSAGTRPSKILMYSIVDFMMTIRNKIRQEDVDEWISLSLAASEGRKYRVIDTPKVPSTLSCGVDKLDALALVCCAPAQSTSMFTEEGNAFSPVRGIRGLNSPIVLPMGRPGRPHASSSLHLPSSSIIPQSPRVALPVTSSPLLSRTPFPTELPPINLSLAQTKERYGLPKAEVDPVLAEDVEYFRQWSQNPFQLDRMGSYTRPVQTETWEACFALIRGYIGYASKYHTPPRATHPTTLKEAYTNPYTFVAFVSYVKARGVRKGFINSHIKVAKKVTKYFEAKEEEEDAKRALSKLHDWLVALDQQIFANMSEPRYRKVIPDCVKLHTWVDRLAEGAKRAILADRPGNISLSTAFTVQATIVAMFVTGRHTGAPCRLSLIHI